MSFITTLLGHLNYGTIFLLMLLESTVIPVPSELVVAPAAYHAAGGNLNMWLVILFASYSSLDNCLYPNSTKFLYPIF